MRFRPILNIAEPEHVELETNEGQEDQDVPLDETFLDLKVPEWLPSRHEHQFGSMLILHINLIPTT